MTVVLESQSCKALCNTLLHGSKEEKEFSKMHRRYFSLFEALIISIFLAKVQSWGIS